MAAELLRLCQNMFVSSSRVKPTLGDGLLALVHFTKEVVLLQAESSTDNVVFDFFLYDVTKVTDLTHF